jgi:hypothetical protein
MLDRLKPGFQSLCTSLSTATVDKRARYEVDAQKVVDDADFVAETGARKLK